MSQCTAKSKTAGRQCGQRAIEGGNVCHYHGGAAPQVKAKAALRLALLVDPAIGQMGKLIKSKHQPTSLGACRDVLDRNGLKTAQEIKLTGAVGIISPEKLQTLTDDELQRAIGAAQQLTAVLGGVVGGEGAAQT